MTIKWNREEILFDTLYEADTWADSIANEIYGRIYNGYDTPDYKIAYSLAFRLASIKSVEFIQKIVLKVDIKFGSFLKLNSKDEVLI